MRKKPRKNQEDEIPLDLEPETERATARRIAYGRAAQFLVTMYNGRWDGALAPSPSSHTSFTSDQRLLANRNQMVIDRHALMCDVIEDVAFDVGVAIFAASSERGWKPEDGLDGLAQDITPEYALTLGGQIEQSLREKAAGAMTGITPDYADADPRCHRWATHVFRLGQVSALHPAESDPINTAPDPSELAALYNDCARIVISFWPEVERLARSSNQSQWDGVVADPRLLETVFNQRFIGLDATAH
jgi:hypothetical protein